MAADTFSVDTVHHVGLTVRDLERSIAFYHEVLGLSFVHEPTDWFEGPDLGRAVGVEGASLRLVTLACGSVALELLEYRLPPSDTSAPLASHNLGASHVAFLVEDIHLKKAELEAKGIRFFSGVNTVDEGVLAGIRWVYFNDPDGYPLELIQIAYTRYEDRARRLAAYLSSRRERPSKATPLRR